MKKYEKYVPSSIPGIDAIPSHWREAPIKQLVEINPESLGEKTDAELLINYIDIGNVNSYGEIKEIQPIIFKDAPSRARRIVRKGDVVVSTVRTYLKAIAAVESDEENLIASTGFAVLRADEENVAASYLKYAVRGGYFIEEVVANSTGVSYPAISSTPFSRIKLILPSYEEQRTIATYLDHKTAQLDTLLTQKETLVRLLHQKRQALINEAVTQGLDPAAPRKSSGVEWLGDIPAHWEVRKLKQLTTRIVDGTHFTPNYIEEGVPFLRVTDIQTDEIDLSTTKFISQAEHEELSKRCKPEKGDILLSKNGTIGITKVVHWDWEFSVFVSLCLIKPTKRLNPYYFSYFFQSDIVNQQIDEGSRTTSVTNLHLEKIRELLISLPPIEEQLQIVERLNLAGGRINEASDAIHTQIKTLKAYRQSLISEVVTGKVDVRTEAQALAGTAPTPSPTKQASQPAPARRTAVGQLDLF